MAKAGARSASRDKYENFMPNLLFGEAVNVDGLDAIVRPKRAVHFDDVGCMFDGGGTEIRLGPHML